MASSSNRRRRGREQGSSLPAAFLAPDDHRRQAAAFLAFRASPGPREFDEAFAAYLPVVLKPARYFQRRRPRVDDFDDYVQDAAAGLHRLLAHLAAGRWNCDDAHHFRCALITTAFRAVRRGMDARRGVKGHRTDRERILANFRRRYAYKNRAPAPPETVSEFIASQLTNPAFTFELRRGPKTKRESDVTPEEWQAVVESVEDDDPTPDEEAAQRELMTLARRTLRGLDLQIFRRLMRGEGNNDIARALGLGFNVVSRRTRGLMWELRQRTDLAVALGVEPTRPEDVPHRPKCPLPPIDSVPPARRIA